jgi:predicted esterase
LPEAPRWIDGDGAAAFVYPPAAADGATGRAVTVLLHGLCGHPERACAPFAGPSTARGWLVCPRGEDACGGGSRWRLRPEDDGRVVEAAVGSLARDYEDDVDAAGPRVLVGFSLGGIAAVQLAQSSRGRYAGLVVIASQVHPDPAELARAGVKRLVLAAGDLDMTSAPLRADARACARAGLPTRFVSLGQFGHGYPADMGQRMAEPMAWVAGAD